jgi:hypothetical protein
LSLTEHVFITNSFRYSWLVFYFEFFYPPTHYAMMLDDIRTYTQTQGYENNSINKNKEAFYLQDNTQSNSI